MYCILVVVCNPDPSHEVIGPFPTLEDAEAWKAKNADLFSVELIVLKMLEPA